VTSSSSANPAATLPELKPAGASRLLFIDNIRVFLTILVLLHHTMIIYAGSGNWIYMEGDPGIVVNALGGWFCATNQAYFMGLFCLSALTLSPVLTTVKGRGAF
jgi:glucans biosynthesis protein C